MSHIPAAFPERRYKHVHPAYYGYQERRLCGTTTALTTRGGPYNPLSDTTLKLNKAQKEIDELRSQLAKLAAERDILRDALDRANRSTALRSIPPPPMFSNNSPIATAPRRVVNNVTEAVDLIPTTR